MIEIRTKAVFYAPTKRRHYFTKKAAIAAEARAIIERKYPSECSHTDSFGRIEDPGWHWTALPRSDVLLRRVSRMVASAGFLEAQR